MVHQLAGLQPDMQAVVELQHILSVVVGIRDKMGWFPPGEASQLRGLSLRDLDANTQARSQQ